MSTSSLLPTSMLESLGIGIVQKVADLAFGPGVLTLSDDSNGIGAGLKLASGQAFHLDGLTANAQGISGRLYIDGLDTNPLSATLFDGFTVALTAFDITLAKSGLAASHIGGHLTLPFFTDSSGNPKTVDIEISTKADGTLSISLAAVESTQPSTADGLVQLIYDLPGGLGTVEIDVASLEVDKTVDGIWKLVISGNLIIEAASLSWPSIELRGLGIDSKGHISLDGGWIDLPSQMALDFYGFHLALQKLGFGSDNTGRWIGFNGDIHLVEGLSLGGSVRGLRINLTTGAVSLDGVGISFEIPDVLTIDGEIDHIHVDANTPKDLSDAGLMSSIFDFIQPLGPTAPAGGKKVDVFAGQVKVVIMAAGDLEVDAGFIVGNFGGQSVFFLDIDAELPVGIPIFLDVSLYGLQGLFATGLQPQPEPNNTWWEWYKYPAGSTGPDLSQNPDYTATDVHKWLVPKQGALAIGAGATIGTEADDGFTASAAITFVLMLPGPVISLIGKANILSKRLGGASQDANFEAMATYDGNSQTFDLVIDAKYEIPVVLDIEATAELYVGGGEWFFALGKPPHDKRVKARIFDLFEADAYFVISDHGLITGTWTGYKNSWSFGPLAVSLDAYLATLAAIQWSPLQIAGGIELYGNIQLSAFGIGLGLTADALLEACAPNPFWIHGELSVELDTPWPLPNIGATISLTWGGDDGSIPPAPLALTHIDATLVDHCDSADKQASDHYVLLTHRDNGFTPDLTVTYDSGTPGILDLTGDSLTNWQARVAASPIVPDLDPDNPPTGQTVPVLPQDAHFTLNFSHPTADAAGPFEAAVVFDPNQSPWNTDVVTAALPSQVGADDMSNINPNPPAVQFLIRHSLTAVELYEYDSGAQSWDFICAAPRKGDPPPAIGETRLNGVWLSGDPSKSNPRQIMTQLKVFLWRLLPGQSWNAEWSSQSATQNYGTSFIDQGLQFSTADGVGAGTISGLGSGTVVPGLAFDITGSGANPRVIIRFPQSSILNSISALVWTRDGEFSSISQPQCSGDGAALTPTSSAQDSTTAAWTLNFADDGPAVSEIEIPLAGTVLILYAVDYSTPPVPMAILPEAPAVYALKTTTRIQASRVGTNNFEDVPNGNPVVEFVYFQTASGPGTAGPYPAPAMLAVPAGPAPYLALAQGCNSDQQPTSAFPLGGALNDLRTYTQWSWPLDGASSAYYGYDVNVEFCESYINALYTRFSYGQIANSLHFRCVDRNNRHTLLVPNAIHVPSIPQQSALVAGPIDIPLPKPLQPTAAMGTGIARVNLAALAKRAQLARVAAADSRPDAAPEWVPTSLAKLVAKTNLLNNRAGDLAIQQIDPVLAGDILQQIMENEARDEANALWFKPLLPSTRYTLDVVAGPLLQRGDRATLAAYNSESSLSAIFAAADAIAVLAALKSYLAYEDSLTTLERVQFTTSRYATFTAHMANAARQLAGDPSVTPIRRYQNSVNTVTWLEGVGPQLTAWAQAAGNYIEIRTSLRTLVGNFDPLADDLQPGIAPSDHGAAALVAGRKATADAWNIFSSAASSFFDASIAAFGYPQFSSRATPIRVPDTELSFFTDANDEWVEGIMIESPEPLPWQRIWQSIRILSAAGTAAFFLPLWNADGTRGLLIPLEHLSGNYTLTVTFLGNIGAETSCITADGASVTEAVPIGTVRMGPTLVRLPIGVVDHPVLKTLRNAHPLLEALGTPVRIAQGH